jgi:hypothetical protein
MRRTLLMIVAAWCVWRVPPRRPSGPRNGFTPTEAADPYFLPLTGGRKDYPGQCTSGTKRLPVPSTWAWMRD